MQDLEARFSRSIIRPLKGVKIDCIANSILPPGTTMLLERGEEYLAEQFARPTPS